LGRNFTTTLISGRTAITDSILRSHPAPSNSDRNGSAPEHSHHVLELPAVLGSIAGRTRSVPARERVLDLRPLASVASARAAQGIYADLFACRDAGDPPPAAAPPDVRPELERLEREGAILRGEELARIATLLEQTHAIAFWHGRTRREIPGLSRILDALDPLEALRKELARAIDPSGDVRDDASPELARIRRSIRSLRELLASRLESVLRGLSSPESFVTLREDRYVIAVPSGMRRDVPGSIVGHSGSGASLFVEPREAAEANSELAERALDEIREVERILRHLSALAHRDVTALQRDFESLTRLDAAQAVIAWAVDSGAVLPELNEDRVLRLRGARHPILVERHRKGEIGSPVPLDLELDPERPMLLVTGPNMGGKTVAMKTVGLLALLAEMGIPVPAAAGTSLPWLDHVICDIGDEQSIQADVSTFLSHIRRVSEALERATSRSLVLLDELGSGTDPVEGAALGQAVLERLLERGALCVATTHHGMLKTFAHDSAGIRNASMAFDEGSLRPMFRLVVGVPGGSRAIQAAERHGMDSSVLARARELLPQGERDLNRLLEELGRLREDARGERAALERARGDLKAREAELKTALERLESERKERKQAELHARRELLRQLEGQIDEYRKKLRTESKATVATLQEARSLAKGIEESIDREAEPEPATAASGAPVHEVKPGDRLFVPTLRAEAVALTEPDADGRVRVRIGGATAVLPLAQLRRSEGGAEGSAGRSGPKSKTAPSAERLAARPARSHDAPEVGPEIDVRGYDAEDALQAVERFLENAAVGGLTTARIIHGKGTGVLRERVKRWLQTNSLVKDFRLGEIGEGGTGVTIVTLT